MIAYRQKTLYQQDAIKFMYKESHDMLRVLVVGVTSIQGGLETFIHNYYVNFDNRIHLDFLCAMMDKMVDEDFYKENGSKVYHISSKTKDYLRYKRELRAFFEQHSQEYDVIWLNVNSLANIDYLVYAKKYNIPIRIVHSHNSANMGGKVTAFFHALNRNRIGRYANEYWACSEDAAHWFYNEKLISKSKIINNAIDVSKYSYSEEKRMVIRKKYGLGDAYVIGNVGRLHFQKNQEFALKVFKAYLEKDHDCYLLFVGEGEDKQKLQYEVDKLEIPTERVIFTGVQFDIQAYLSSFDLFLFPSLFEGLSIAALEAQANGVAILASDKAVHNSLRLSNNVFIKSLNDTSEKWAEEIALIKSDMTREDNKLIEERFTSAGYSIKTEALKLEEYLISKYNMVKQNAGLYNHSLS